MAAERASVARRALRKGGNIRNHVIYSYKGKRFTVPTGDGMNHEQRNETTMRFQWHIMKFLLQT